MIKYDNHSIDINYILNTVYTSEERQTITNDTYSFMSNYFYSAKYKVQFLEDYKHDYLKKFKIIVKKDDTDAEPVGGFFRY